MIVGRPSQKRARFLQLFSCHDLGRTSHIRKHLGNFSFHRRKIVDRGTHVTQHRNQAIPQRLDPCGIGDPFDFDMHPRLDAIAALGIVELGQDAMLVAACIEQWMEYELNRDALSVDFHRDRIDQEWHVIVYKFNHGAGALPAVIRLPGTKDAHLRCAALEFVTERQMRQRECRPFGCIARHEIVDIDFAAIFGGKHLRLHPLRSRRFGGNQFLDVRKEYGFAIFGLGRHDKYPMVFRELALS